jgi:hypothetical protein
MLYKRDIAPSVAKAISRGAKCVPIIVTQSWDSDLELLNADGFIHIEAHPANPEVLHLLKEKLTGLLPLFLTV